MHKTKVAAAILALIIFSWATAHAQVTHPDASTPFVLTWQDNSDNEDGFILQRSFNGGTWTVLAASIGANLETYSDSALQQSDTQDNEYCYKLAAFNSAGTSAYTPAVCGIISRQIVIPNAPDGLQISEITNSEMRISWNPVEGAQGYWLERQTFAPPRDEAFDVANVTTYLDTELKKNKDHCYAAAAYNATDTGPWSEQACARTLLK